MRHRKTACFQALVLHPHFAQMLRPLLATLLFGRQKFAACIIYLNDANCESPGFFQHLPAAHDLERRMIFFPLSMQSPNKHCIETVEPFARADRPNSLVFYLHSKASTTLEGDLLKVVAKMLTSPVPLLSNVVKRQQGSTLLS